MGNIMYNNMTNRPTQLDFGRAERVQGEDQVAALTNATTDIFFVLNLFCFLGITDSWISRFPDFQAVSRDSQSILLRNMEMAALLHAKPWGLTSLHT